MYVLTYLLSLFLISFAVKQVFPSLEFIGWYTVTPKPTPHHIALHEQVCPIPSHFFKMILNQKSSLRPIALPHSC